SSCRRQILQSKGLPGCSRLSWPSLPEGIIWRQLYLWGYRGAITGARLPKGRPETRQGLGRRLRPGPLLLPQLLEFPRELQDAKIVEALADDLQPDGKPAPGIAGIDRGRRLLRHVE